VASFKQRVESFWTWYQEVGPRFYQTIEDGRCPDLADEVVAKVDELFPPLAWVFGRGPSEVGGHSFTLSGEGVRHKQFLTEYWLEQAPQIEGWTFYASRQPGELNPEHAIRIGDDMHFAIGEMKFASEVDEENEIVHLELFHPLFPQLEEEMRLQVTFLLLDEVLGEYGVEQWIGGIDTIDVEPANSRRFAELRDLIHDLEISHKWKKVPPTQSGAVYQLEPDEETIHRPRGDIIIGSTLHTQLVSEFVESEGNLRNPIQNTGADFAYLEFSSANLPNGSEVGFRTEIEEAVNERFLQARCGHSIGGAFGARNAYIDFLLCDPEGLEIMRQELVARNLVGDKAIRFFSNDRMGDAIEL